MKAVEAAQHTACGLRPMVGSCTVGALPPARQAAIPMAMSARHAYNGAITNAAAVHVRQGAQGGASVGRRSGSALCMVG